MECISCGQEVAQTLGKRAKLYCSDKCRKAYKRTTITGQSISGHSPVMLSTSVTTKVVPLTQTPDMPWYLTPDKLTITDVKSMTHTETKAILEHWRSGNGTAHQQDMGWLASQYPPANRRSKVAGLTHNGQAL